MRVVCFVSEPDSLRRRGSQCVLVCSKHECIEGSLYRDVESTPDAMYSRIQMRVQYIVGSWTSSPGLAPYQHSNEYKPTVTWPRHQTLKVLSGRMDQVTTPGSPPMKDAKIEMPTRTSSGCRRSKSSSGWTVIVAHAFQGRFAGLDRLSGHDFRRLIEWTFFPCNISSRAPLNDRSS